MGRILDVEGKELESPPLEKYPEAVSEIDPQSIQAVLQKTLGATDILREVLQKIIEDKKLTFLQALAAVEFLQSQMVSTLLQKEHSKIVEEQTEE